MMRQPKQVVRRSRDAAPIEPLDTVPFGNVIKSDAGLEV
jgi:hypothetical protein